MTGGLNDTKTVKVIMGQRLQKARKDAGLSRNSLAERLNKYDDRPVINENQEEMNPERLKQWEYGNNPISLEWLPLICKALDCDVGYLFGEYEEYTIDKQKIREKTKLSTKAIDWLLKNKVENPHLVNALNELFEYDDLADTLFSAVFDFAVSHFSHIVVSDVLKHTDKRMGSGESKRILKFSVQECFSDVLDRIWDENQRVSMAMASMQINRMKEENKEISQEIGIIGKKKGDNNG